MLPIGSVAICVGNCMEWWSLPYAQKQCARIAFGGGLAARRTRRSGIARAARILRRRCRRARIGRGDAACEHGLHSERTTPIVACGLLLCDAREPPALQFLPAALALLRA